MKNEFQEEAFRKTNLDISAQLENVKRQMEASNYSKARKIITDASEIYIDYPPLIKKTATLFMLLGMYDEALNEYEKYCDEKCFINMAMIYLNKHDKEGLKKVWDKYFYKDELEYINSNDNKKQENSLKKTFIKLKIAIMRELDIELDIPYEELDDKLKLIYRYNKEYALKHIIKRHVYTEDKTKEYIENVDSNKLFNENIDVEELFNNMSLLIESGLLKGGMNYGIMKYVMYYPNSSHSIQGLNTDYFVAIVNLGTNEIITMYPAYDIERIYYKNNYNECMHQLKIINETKNVELSINEIYTRVRELVSIGELGEAISLAEDYNLDQNYIETLKEMKKNIK